MSENALQSANETLHQTISNWRLLKFSRTVLDATAIGDVRSSTNPSTVLPSAAGFERKLLRFAQTYTSRLDKIPKTDQSPIKESL